MASIDLTRYGLTTVESDDVGVFRLRVVASDPVGIDANIFVYKQSVPVGSASDLLDEYTNVASVADMAEYPVDTPSEDTEFPFFRDNEIVLDFRSSRDCEYAWVEIQRRVRQLCEATARLADMVAQETITISS